MKPKKTKAPKFREYFTSTDGCFMFHQVPTVHLLKYDLYFFGMEKVAEVIYRVEEDTGEIVCEMYNTANVKISDISKDAFRQSGDELDVVWASGLNRIAEEARKKLKLRRTKPKTHE